MNAYTHTPYTDVHDALPLVGHAKVWQAKLLDIGLESEDLRARLLLLNERPESHRRRTIVAHMDDHGAPELMLGMDDHGAPELTSGVRAR